MIVIEVTPAPVPEPIVEQVLELVSDNTTDLAMAHPPKSHPLFSAFRLLLVTEVRMYLSWQIPSQMELVTATENGKVLGFALCGFSPSGECGIYYMAVTRLRREQGIMSMMVRDVVARHSKISLSCDVQLVPRYERYGFVALELRKHQVVMVIGNPIEETPVLDPDSLMRLPAVLQEQYEASERSTEHAVNQANKMMKKNLRAAETRAKQYFQQRLRKQG